jgi:hypothetical protein
MWPLWQTTFFWRHFTLDLQEHNSEMHNAIQQYNLLETFSTIPTLSFILLKQSYILNVLVMTRLVYRMHRGPVNGSASFDLQLVQNSGWPRWSLNEPESQEVGEQLAPESHTFSTDWSNLLLCTGVALELCQPGSITKKESNNEENYTELDDDGREWISSFRADTNMRDEWRWSRYVARIVYSDFQIRMRWVFISPFCYERLCKLLAWNWLESIETTNARGTWSHAIFN